IQAELGCSLLGVVDDVIERSRERVAVAGCERCAQAPAGRQAVDDVVRDAIAFLLADLQVLSQSRALGILGEQIAQQQARPLHVALARRLGTIVRRDELFSSVWGGDLRPGDRSVDVYISKLRSKLEKAMPDRRYIHTHPGFGYRLQPQPSPRAEAAAPGAGNV